MRDYIAEFKALTKGTRYSDSEELYMAFRHMGVEGERFVNMVIENDLNVSQSPYSQSIYAYKGDDDITWNYKPQDSLRISDHWNFDGHCITRDGIKRCLMICKYDNGIYTRI